MSRTKNYNKSLKKKYLKFAKGYTCSNSNLYILAVEQAIQSFNFAYKSRKLKKRNFKKLWIGRISIITKLFKISYSKFVGTLRKSRIFLNKKCLAYLAHINPKILQRIFLEAKNSYLFKK